MIVLVYDGANPQQIIASTAVAASPEVVCLCSYRERTSTTFEPKVTASVITNTPSAVVCDSPSGSGVSHIIDSIIAHNDDNISHLSLIHI